MDHLAKLNGHLYNQNERSESSYEQTEENFVRDVDGHRCSKDRPISFHRRLVTVILIALFDISQTSSLALS